MDNIDNIDNIEDNLSQVSYSTDDSILSDTPSIINDINDLTEKCYQLQEYIDSSYQILQELNSQIRNSQLITVSYEGWTGDFEEIINRLHSRAIDNIQKYGKNNFGELLLDIIDKINFD